MSKFKTCGGFLFCVAFMSFPGRAAMARDAVEVAGEFYEVALENSFVRVLRATYAPGEVSALHEHPPSVVVQMTGGKLRFTGSNGDTIEQDLPEGRVAFSGGSHRVENIGEDDIGILISELKSRPSLLGGLFGL